LLHIRFSQIIPKTFNTHLSYRICKILPEMFFSESQQESKTEFKKHKPFNMFCIIFTLCVTCLVNKLLQYNTIQTLWLIKENCLL
jgi:hypothetical protein